MTVLILKTSGDWSDAAIEKAADELLAACYETRTLSLSQRSANGVNLRRTTDYAREILALRSQVLKGNEQNTATWIEPHTNELKGGYNVGREVFNRLEKATTDRTPEEVARLLVLLFDRPRFVIDHDLPSEALDKLSKRLEGAKPSDDLNPDDLNKAKAFISNYRGTLRRKP